MCLWSIPPLTKRSSPGLVCFSMRITVCLKLDGAVGWGWPAVDGDDVPNVVVAVSGLVGPSGPPKTETIKHVCTSCTYKLGAY